MTVKEEVEAEIELKPEAKTSVKSYQKSIDAEKQKIAVYSEGFGTSVRSLQADFKKHSEDVKVAALKMQEDGIKNMSRKVERFEKEIRDQIKENKESVSRMADNVRYFISEINKKKEDFQSYTRGPFKDYIKAFWG